jgi:CubicO group peptidase (beta-lactamase class C family)
MKIKLLSALSLLALVSCVASPTATLMPSPTSTPLPTSTPIPTPYWPTEGWKTSSPEQQGVDSEQLAKMFDAIQQKNANIHSLLVIRHGCIVAEAYFHPYQAEIPHELQSVTKSVVSALVGIAIQEGYIDGVGHKVVDFFSDRTIANNDARKQKMTLKDLLTMTSGLGWIEESPLNMPSLSQMVSQKDWAQYVLDRPMVADPGTTFNYGSGGPQLLSAILQKTAGMSTLAFAQKSLFKRLGISNVSWQADPSGITAGGWGLQLTPRDMAKLGYLYLHDGVWDGQPVVPAAWVKASTTKYIDASNGQDYGYLWWVQRTGSFGARGHGGQYILVFPGQDMIVVFTGGISDPNIDLPLQWAQSFIVPAAQSPAPLPANPAGVARLQASIQAVEQPQPKPVPPLPAIAKIISGKTYVFGSNPIGAQSSSFTFEGGRAWSTFQNSNMGSIPITAEVGLDDVFRITPAGPAGLLAFKGYWQDEKTFVLYQQIVGQAERMMAKMTFEGDTVTIQGEALMDGLSGEFSGKLQK